MSRSKEELAKWNYAVSALQRWGFRVSLVDGELWLPEKSFIEVVEAIEADCVKRSEGTESSLLNIKAIIDEEIPTCGDSNCRTCIERHMRLAKRLTTLNNQTKEPQ